eukprot:1201257-Rhodomonas_salina.1
MDSLVMEQQVTLLPHALPSDTRDCYVTYHTTRGASVGRATCGREAKAAVPRAPTGGRVSEELCARSGEMRAWYKLTL